jgi:large-conductance mechanosensitive channel
MNTLLEVRKRRQRAAEAEVVPEPTDIELLTEIRDLLRVQRGNARA